MRSVRFEFLRKLYLLCVKPFQLGKCVRFMLANELFEWIAILTQDEQLAFSKYLQGEEHQRKKLPPRLYAWLLANPNFWRDLDGWESKRNLQEELNSLLFPGKELKTQRIRRVFMDLKFLLEDFISLKAAPRFPQKIDQELRLLKYLLEKGASGLFQKRLSSIESYLKTEVPHSPDTYIASIWVAQMRTEFCIHHNIPDDRFEHANALAAEYYLVRSLENFTAMRLREQFHGKAHQYLFETEIQAMSAAVAKEKDGLVALWRNVYALVSPDAQMTDYNETLLRLERLKATLPLITIRQVRGYLFNFMIKTQDLGKVEYYVRLWELLCVMLQEGTLHMPDGRLTFPFFISTIRSACLAGKHGWAQEFIDMHSEDLVGDGREEQIHYCKLLVGFYAGKLNETWLELLRFSPKDLRIDSLTRTLQVQVAYDLDKEEEFGRLVNALSKFITRNQMLGARVVEMVRKFARFAISLGHARYTSQRLPKGLAARLNNLDTAEKIWLLEKVHNLQ